MSETTELIIGIFILLVAINLTRKYHAWKIKRAYIFIIEDLKAKSAFDPESAIDLPYARKNMLNRLRIGVRDHRPTALDHLVLNDIVGGTENGKYYLKDKSVLSRLQS